MKTWKDETHKITYANIRECTTDKFKQSFHVCSSDTHFPNFPSLFWTDFFPHTYFFGHNDLFDTTTTKKSYNTSHRGPFHHNSAYLRQQLNATKLGMWKRWHEKVFLRIDETCWRNFFLMQVDRFGKIDMNYYIGILMMWKSFGK